MRCSGRGHAGGKLGALSFRRSNQTSGCPAGPVPPPDKRHSCPLKQDGKQIAGSTTVREESGRRLVNAGANERKAEHEQKHDGGVPGQRAMLELEDPVAGTVEAAPVEPIIVDFLFLEGREVQLWGILYNLRSLIAESARNEKDESARAPR